MAFAFPTATVVGQLYSYGGTTWEWSGSVWNVQPSFGEITVSVSGPSEIDTKSGDLILDSATGDTQVDDNLTVVGTSALNGDVTMGANASVAGTSALTGDVTMGASATVAGNHDVTGGSNIGGNVMLGGTLDVTGNTVMQGTLNVQDTATVAGLIASGASNLQGDVLMQGNATVNGNLNVLGTMTSVQSTTVTISDPVFTLGGDTPLAADDSLDKGIEFQWHDGTGAKTGFFGWNRDEMAFTFMPDAVNGGEVFSGAVGTVKFGEGHFEGAVLPSTDATYDLGSSSAMWKDIYLSGAISSASIAGGNVQIAVTDPNTIDTSMGNLTIDSMGTITLAKDVDMLGMVTVGGNLSVNLNANITGTLNVNGATALMQTTFNGAAIPVGDVLHDLGSATDRWKEIFSGNVTTTMLATDSATVGTTLDVTGAATMSSTLGVTGAATMGDTLAVTNGATVGGTLDVTGAATMASATISGNANPDVANTHDLGAAGTEWANVHVGTSIMLQGSALTTMNGDLYVDGMKHRGGAIVDENAPAMPDEGDFWLDRNTGNLYIWVIDGGTGIGNWIQPL